jgi:hypothetical protein
MRAQTFAMVLASVGGLLGLLHIALTPLAYADWTIEALWFVGSGLAIVVAGAANFVGFRSWGLGGQWILTAINLAMSCYLAAAWLVLPGPQVMVGGLLFLGLAICSLAAPRTKAVTH